MVCVWFQAGKTADVCRDLEDNLKEGFKKVTDTIEVAYKAFEKCLREGVEKSKSSYEEALKSFLKIVSILINNQIQ